jgi:hypothetical protein
VYMTDWGLRKYHEQFLVSSGLFYFESGGNLFFAALYVGGNDCTNLAHWLFFFNF